MNNSVEETFLQRLPQDQQEARVAWQSLRHSNEDVAAVTTLIQVLHRLAGAALSVGYTPMGNAARQLEIALQEPGLSLQMPVLETLYADLQTAIAARARDCIIDEQQRIEPPVKNDSSLQGTRSNSLIYIVEDDPVQAASLTTQVRHFGYAVQTFTRLPDLRAALQEAVPAAILMDIIFPEGELAGTAEIQAMQIEFGDSVPVFFLTARADATARLQAIRAGGKGYFTKPVDVGGLVDELDQLIVETDPQPYRILIVDDSEVQAKANAMHLRKAKMETSILTQALDVLRALEDFNPDLLLLDLYMPGCTGLEVAKMIRQIKTFVSLPIVYLSAETDRERQLAAVGYGGDDFLTKPIKPDHLISAVASRIERYRQLQALMLHDSLTGLFNHTTVRERLVQEVAHARRTNTPLSVAMVDIDYFKEVNDTYGHGTGDRVLKSLSRLLLRRLRRSDVIGRYGGEEFILLLPNTPADAAMKLIGETREAFAQIKHVAGDKEFNVTFSCGVAALRNKSTPSALSEAADQALYAAKRQGRNQVVLA